MNDKVVAKICKSGNFPTLPEILIKLIDACDDESRPLAEIADIISKDPVLSFKVLQLVNSAYYGIRKTFTNIEQAVIFLGAKSVKNIAITTAIHQVFEHKHFRHVKQFSIKNFWWHSLLCATLSKRIAHKIGIINIDEVYLSSLLHDIGRIVLISTFPQQYISVFTETTNSDDSTQAEKQILGTTHCEVGAWLVRKWHMASLMADAIEYHHDPLDKISESFPLIKIVYYANILSTGFDQKMQHGKIGQELLGLGNEEIKDIMRGVALEVNEIAAGLEISIQQPVFDMNPKIGETPPPKDVSYEKNVAETGEKDRDLHEVSPAQQELTARIKNISLLTGFLENMIQAGESDKIINAFEQCVNILFNIENVLFFLPDKQNALLRGAASHSSPFHKLSQDLILPRQSGTSKIVQAFQNGAIAYLTSDDKDLGLADEQLLAILEKRSVLLLPMEADKEPAGIILLGLPKGAQFLPKSDCKILQVIAQQIGLSLYLERLKASKKIELEQERMEAVSMTAKKFAHEINNPLGIISNYLTSLKLKLSQENSVQEDIAVINEEINRISSMVNQLDLFAQPVSRTMQTIDLNSVLEDIIQLVKTSLFSDTGSVLSFRPQLSLPPLHTSRDGIKQIMLNLIKNSAEAMADGGTIEIATQAIGPESGINGKAGIEIIISDSGPGLPEKIKNNLYKPFMTTKGAGHSGLGLSIVHKAVKVLGGEISCRSERLQGTTFTIYLPLENS